jgi:hypothetical protein
MRVGAADYSCFIAVLAYSAASLLPPFAEAVAPPAACTTPEVRQVNEVGNTAKEGDPALDRPESSEQARDVVAGPIVWGIAGLRGYGFGQQTAPNGLEFNPLFTLDLDLNLWLWRVERLYAFTDTRFWAQRASPGVTNSSQGIFDFSKREFDLDLGVAWNYFGMLEARGFAYSFNNLNRGSSDVRPTGYNDGVGFENRLYVGGTYADLGQPGFDVARANFLGVGYYPTKDLVDADGNVFKPGPFARAYLTLDLFDGGGCYLYLDSQLIGTRSFGAKLVDLDAGAAVRPFRRVPALEFRFGSEDTYDLQLREIETSLYLGVRFVF